MTSFYVKLITPVVDVAFNYVSVETKRVNAAASRRVVQTIELATLLAEKVTLLLALFPRALTTHASGSSWYVRLDQLVGILKLAGNMPNKSSEQRYPLAVCLKETTPSLVTTVPVPSSLGCLSVSFTKREKMNDERGGSEKQFIQQIRSISISLTIVVSSSVINCASWRRSEERFN